jgi:phosphatidylglycerol:prolipoprotein diacylglycerol transferase
MLPILYQSPNIVIYSYPLLMGLGWGVAYQFFMASLPRAFPRIFSQLIFCGLFLSSWVGSKFLFLLTRPEGKKLAEDLSFWTGGGFVFYGGLIFGGMFLYLVKILKPQQFPVLSSALLPALPIGHAIGRVGCYLAGCCYGEVTTAFWAIYQHGENRHPTQLMEAFGLGLIGYFLMKRRTLRKNLLAPYLLSYGGLRLMVELLRGDEVRGMWGGQPPSIVISVLLMGLGFFLYIQEKMRT